MHTQPEVTAGRLRLSPIRPGHDWFPNHNTYVGDICKWHDHCNDVNTIKRYNYNCNPLFGHALLQRCAQWWGASPVEGLCEEEAKGYLTAVAAGGALDNLNRHDGTPPADIGYPPNKIPPSAPPC